MKGFTKRQLCIALYTASQYSSSGDVSAGGLLLYRLSSNRKVDDEEHREALKGEIVNDMTFAIKLTDEQGDWKDAKREVARLLDLYHVVATCPVGEEWLTDKENMKLNDQLYDAGVL